MCHTIAEPHSGKYLFCCSPEAVRVWSYETAIECHDSIMCPRPKETGGAVEMHADSTMLQDMKVMIGSIQDAFVSIWLLDVNQLRPFNNSTGATSSSSAARNKQQEPPRAPVTVPYAHQQQPSSFNRPPSASAAQPPLSARNPATSSTDRLAPDSQNRVAVSSRPTTPAVVFPPQSSNAALGTGNAGRFVEEPRRSCTILTLPEDDSRCV